VTTRIKISDNDANRAALAAYLAPIEARCSARKITAAILTGMIASAEDLLTNIELPKSAWPSARYVFSEGGIQNVANSYKDKAGPRASSVATIERGSSCWYLIGAERREFWPKAKDPTELLLTPAQGEEAIRRFASKLKVYPIAA
jgi:hypothetical protein